MRFTLLFFITSIGVAAQNNVHFASSFTDGKPYALVAGGSKGIGYAIAEALAKRGYNLVLIARHRDSLDEAEHRLALKYHVHVSVLVYDLAYDTAAQAIARWCSERNINLRMLCNVAGFGGSRDYLKLPADSLRYMIRLNVESPACLTYALLPLLEAHTPSYIINVASMAAFAPIPLKNLYSATKSAMLYFSYSLHYQLKDKNIHVSCLSPGPVFTKPAVIEDTKKQLGWFGKQMAMSPAKVGEVAVKKTLKGKLLIVPGTLPKITSAFIRVMPRRWITALYADLGKE